MVGITLATLSTDVKNADFVETFFWISDEFWCEIVIMSILKQTE